MLYFLVISTLMQFCVSINHPRIYDNLHSVNIFGSEIIYYKIRHALNLYLGFSLPRFCGQCTNASNIRQFTVIHSSQQAHNLVSTLTMLRWCINIKNTMCACLDYCSSYTRVTMSYHYGV